MKTSITFVTLLILITMNAQEKIDESLPYHKIPDYPETYTAGTIVSRMIDGLGFRYYWATHGLNKENMNYKPSETGRTITETIDHLYDLSQVIYNTAKKEINDRTIKQNEQLTFKEKRKRTLFNLKTASDVFISVKDLTEYTVAFKFKEGSAEYPFWNQINGPIEDAVWHCGQVVVLRRASGNPIDPKVNVFLGERKEN